MFRRLFLVVTLAIPAVTMAQKESNTPQFELYAGYQFTRIDTGFVQDEFNLLKTLNPDLPIPDFGRHQNLHGWNFGADENINNWLGGVVDASGGYGTRSLDITALAKAEGFIVPPNVRLTVRTRLRTFTITGGPQFTLRRSSHLQPFARALFGGAFFNDSINVLENNVPQFSELKEDDSGFTLGGGGGINIYFSRHVGIRLAADYLRSTLFNDTQNNFRGTAGLVFRLGSR
jgi:opacity protein-like surface antigen